jgi:hypothetical protein
MEDSYVACHRCSIFPLAALKPIRAPLLASEWPSPQSEGKKSQLWHLWHYATAHKNCHFAKNCHFVST